MGLIPRPLKLRLLLLVLRSAVEEVDPIQLGKSLNTSMDEKFGKKASDKSQSRLAEWLRSVAKALEG